MASWLPKGRGGPQTEQSQRYVKGTIAESSDGKTLLMLEAFVIDPLTEQLD